MVTIVLAAAPFAAAVSTVVVERVRRATILAILAALPPGSELIERRGGTSWWHVRVAASATIRVLEVEGRP